MCDPFACVRPMCPVCVPAPPGIFLPTFYRCVSRLPSPPRSLFTDTSTSGRRLLSRPRIRSSRGRAGVSVGLYGCEVRLCDPCARVVSRGVPAPPVSFYRYFFSIFVQYTRIATSAVCKEVSKKRVSSLSYGRRSTLGRVRSCGNRNRSVEWAHHRMADARAHNARRRGLCRHETIGGDR